MTLIVDIHPELQAELERKAADQGIGVEVYAARLLEAAANGPVEPMDAVQHLDVTLREMAQFSHKIPSLPDDAFSRKSLYRDHD